MYAKPVIKHFRIDLMEEKKKQKMTARTHKSTRKSKVSLAKSFIVMVVDGNKEKKKRMILTFH